MERLIRNIIRFFRTDIWRIQLRDFSTIKKFFIIQLRVIVLALRGFSEDQCSLKASALTFYSLLSLVPVVAMAFGIAKGFGLETLLKNQLMEGLQPQQDAVKQIIEFANSLIENTKGGLVGGIGVAVLLWTVVKVLGNIEHAFNDIWGIKRGRSLARKFSDYCSVMLIGPILLIMSSSITVVLTGKIKLIVEKITLLGIFSPYIMAILKLVPYCAIWVLFAFMYIFMPNTKVKFKSGVIAGIFAGTIYQIVHWAYINFQIGVAKYNAIYGSFAALPLLLAWLQISWLIVLCGAEISFALQNVDTYEFEPDLAQVSYYFKKLLTLRTVHLVVKNFDRGEKPLNAFEIAHTLEIPIRLMNQILYELVRCIIFHQITRDDDLSPCYQPARNINTLTIQFVIDSLEKYGNSNIPVAQTREFHKIATCLEDFDKLIKNSPLNLPLKDI